MAAVGTLSPQDHRLCLLCGHYEHFCQAHTATLRRAPPPANFYLTVKMALRHVCVDSEEDRESLGCDLGQGHNC